MYMIITDFFSVLLNFPLGGIFVFAMVVIHPRQFHIVHDFPLYTLNPLLPWILQISNLEREKEIFFK